MIRCYYRINFQLISAMSLGSGLNDATDSDILRNSQGKPYLPGSSLAGVYRSLFDEERQKSYFGDVKINKREGGLFEEEKAVQSKIFVYDAYLKNEASCISIRDSVALDEYRTAKEGSKFDFEILEPGCTFITYIQQDMENGDENIAEKICSLWKSNDLCFGRKTARGLGRTKLISVEKAAFNLKTQQEAWLDFDMYGNKNWNPVKLDILQNFSQRITINLNLKQEGPISVRKYTTEVSEKGSSPDYTQLSYKQGNKEVPVIPGTSWAGSFRHHMLAMDKAAIGNIFGMEENSKDMKKSAISFSESLITGGSFKVFTRNALNRFTNATVDAALYTEKFYSGGNTELEISFEKKDVTKAFTNLLCACIVDLNLGLLTVGGLSSVGRGLFSITKLYVNKKEVKISNPEEMYKKLCAAISEVK